MTRSLQIVAVPRRKVLEEQVDCCDNLASCDCFITVTVSISYLSR